MQFHITFKNLDPSNRIKCFAEKKSEKLKKFFRGKMNVKWIISQEKNEHTAHLHVLGNRIDYFGESKGNNLLAIIEDSLDKVERQLKKHKEIIKDHHK